MKWNELYEIERIGLSGFIFNEVELIRGIDLI